MSLHYHKHIIEQLDNTMVKAILLILAVLVVASNAQLSTLPKRFREQQQRELVTTEAPGDANYAPTRSSHVGNEFGRRATTPSLRKSRYEVRQLEEIDLSISMSVSYELSMSTPSTGVMGIDDDASIEPTTTPAPESSTEVEEIYCRRDWDCPESVPTCRCGTFFCRFCFLKPCGVCGEE